MTVYLCDMQKEDCKKAGCKEYCRHTTSVSHALNGECADPQNHPERFMLINGQYWERDVHIEKLAAEMEEPGP